MKFVSIIKKTRLLVFLLLAIVMVIAHNLVYALGGFEEPVFFLLAFVFFSLFAAKLLLVVANIFKKLH